MSSLCVEAWDKAAQNLQGKELLLSKVDKEQPKYADYAALVLKGLFDSFLTFTDKKGFSIPPAVEEIIEGFVSGSDDESNLELALKKVNNLDMPFSDPKDATPVSSEDIAPTQDSMEMDSIKSPSKQTAEKEGKEEVEQKKRGRKTLTEYLNPKNMVPELLPVLQTAFAYNSKNDDYVAPARYIHAFGASLPDPQILFSHLHKKGKRRRLPPILIFLGVLFVSNLGFQQALSSANTLLNFGAGAKFALFTTYTLRSHAIVIESENKKVEDDTIFLQVYMHIPQSKSFTFVNSEEGKVFYIGKF